MVRKPFVPGWLFLLCLLILRLSGCVRTDPELTIYTHSKTGEMRAAKEFQHILYRMTGRKFRIASSELCSPRSIYMGQGKPLERAEAIDIPEDGYRIAGLNGALTISGGPGRGLMYGVYTFLEKLGCRKYSATEMVIPKRKHFEIPELNIEEAPVFSFRQVHYKDAFDADYRAWHKLDTHRESWGMWVHTFDDLIPPEKYFESHPEYFSEINGMRIPDGQLCLTNEDVFDLVVRGLRERMRKNPQAKYWSVSQNDTYNPCQCESCRAIDEAQGSHAGSLLAFVNRVAAEFPDKIISTLAYQYTRAAPKTIRPADNVNIVLCSIECNRSRPLSGDPSSASFRKDIADWARIAPNILVWDYTVQFRNLVSPFPNLRVLQPNLQFFESHGVKSHFQQGSGPGGEFAELRTYVIAKLLWDPFVSVDSVMNDFLSGYYGKAAPYLRQYIDSMCDALERSGEDLYIYGYPFPSENGYLSPGQMDRYQSFFDQAEIAVADDRVRLRRVKTARLPLIYAELEQGKVYGTGERGFFVRNEDENWQANPEMRQLLFSFVSNCKRAGITLLHEHGNSPAEYLESMTRFLDVSMESHKALFRPVTLSEPASPKYPAGGSAALTNGIKGLDDYHMNWLGFEGTDMEAVIDLGRVEEVRGIHTDFLQAVMSWVFLPVRVEYSLSEDGQRWTRIGELTNTVDAKTEGMFIHPFHAEFKPAPARFIRVFAENMKVCPEWHKGAGGRAWIFADEIIIR